MWWVLSVCVCVGVCVCVCFGGERIEWFQVDKMVKYEYVKLLFLTIKFKNSV